MVLAGVVLGGLVFGVRLVLGVSALFHESPVDTVRTLVTGHGGSDVAQSADAGHRIVLAVYGYGGLGHDGAYLTDSILLVVIQPQASGPARVAEISVPRDLLVPIQLGAGKTTLARVNEAYSSGRVGAPLQPDRSGTDQDGGRVADDTLAQLLGVPIDHFIGIDFTAFNTAVDSVGGIDVTVQRTFTDHHYPEGECPPDCATTTVHFDAGTQHMDGARALIFARSRESDDPQEGSNFARNKRQQLILTALKQRVLSIGGIGGLPDLLGSLGNHLSTDLPLDDALSLYDLVKNVDSADIVHISIDSSNLIYECGYPQRCNAAYELPYDRTFASVQRYLQNLFVPAAVLAEHAPVTITDAGRQGDATRWASMLSMEGFAATSGGDVPGAGSPPPTTRVLDATGHAGGPSNTARWLAAYYGVTPEIVSAASSPTSTGRASGGAPAEVPAGVSVVLGADATQAFHAQGGLYR